jgi:hypothetical protein
LTTIPAPKPERRRAIASPMPLDEPVTMTALPARSIVVPFSWPQRIRAESLACGSG